MTHIKRKLRRGDEDKRAIRIRQFRGKLRGRRRPGDTWEAQFLTKGTTSNRTQLLESNHGGGGGEGEGDGPWWE